MLGFTGANGRPSSPYSSVHNLTSERLRVSSRKSPSPNMNKQAVSSNQISHQPDTMALQSGVYTIKNVENGNWAVLLNANEGQVVAGSSASTNVGEKVSLSKI
jgi:hypothetical protein